MVWRHKKTKHLYRVLFESFSVERQRQSFVYICISGDNDGAVFDRDAEDFKNKFEPLHDPQVEIEPR